MSALAIKAIREKVEQTEARLLEGSWRNEIEARELVARRKAWLMALEELGAGPRAADLPEDDD